ncbi:MAG: response regulator transcription factor [Chitinophagaceae bacterium]|nr:MAG: response regulator transcription factor [Chitinophagaceae bacterium]
MKKILIIDDDPRLRQALSAFLRNAGYDVTAEEGPENLLAGKYERPDIILLDRHLEATDGLDVCRLLKQQPATSAIPIVMISGSPAVKAQAGQAGANDFIDKPFDLRHILKMIQFHSKYGRGAGSPDETN